MWIEYKKQYVIGDQTIEVTRSDYNGYKAIYHIIGKNEEGQVLLDLIEEEKPNEKTIKYDPPRRVIVEEGWFTKENKRKIKWI